MNPRIGWGVVRLLVALVVGSTAVVGLKTATLSGSAGAATHLPAYVSGAPSGPSPTSSDEEERSAFSLFSNLARAGFSFSARQNPAWNAWKTKCDVGLPDDCAALVTKPSKQLDFFAMEFPTQTIHSYSRVPLDPISQNEYFAAFARAPQLASVLFNPSAANSILRHGLGQRATLDKIIQGLDTASFEGTDRHLPNGTFKEGSIAVKLFWELLPSNGSQPLRVFDANILQMANPTDLTLPPVSSWQNTYKVDFKGSTPCPNPLPAFKRLIPISCFYSAHIKRNDAKALRQLTKDVRETVTGDPYYLNSDDVYAVLVGIHVMRLTPERPQWEWMTFYWMNQDNQQSWKSPWRYFNLMSTDKLRSEAFPEHQYAFSPYMEGVVDGIHANCLNCHRLAAYSAHDGTDRAANAAKMASVDPDPPTRQQQEQEYFMEATQTGLIWSLSTSQNQSEQEGHNRFASALEAYFELVDRRSR